MNVSRTAPKLMDSQLQIERFVDATAVAEHLQITRRQVLDMTRKGTLPGYPLGTGNRRVWRYRLSEVDAYITATGMKESPEAAFYAGNISSRINGGSPRSQKGKL